MKNSLIGYRFGRLVVEGIDDTSYEKIICRCDCGTRKSFFIRNVTRRFTKSCGCISKERIQPDGPTRICNVCYRELQSEAFPAISKADQRRRDTCRKCHYKKTLAYSMQVWTLAELVEKQRKRNAASYRRNKAKILHKNLWIRRSIRQRISDFKASIGCTVCGESEPVCLSFHHLDRNKKRMDVALMPNFTKRFETVLTEMKKCVVVCENCHRKIHSGKISLGMRAA